MNLSDKCSVLTCPILLVILLFSNQIVAEDWSGKWFPKRPGEADPPMMAVNEIEHDSIDNSIAYNNRVKTMGILDPSCDDAQTNLWMDFDPSNISHHKIFLCLQDRRKFEPKLTIEPIFQEYTIPAEYSALHRCMNESISYDYDIPTFGTHRPLWPVYGEYFYVPPQRWVHSLEHGAIVAAYHPCVNKRQLHDFRKLVKQCLSRHIITPYEKLSPERPFVLIAWGKSLELSYVDHNVVVGFIRMNALQGPEKQSRNGQYSAGLIEQAKTVSNDDMNLCPFM